jgi:hypothetical protein
MMYGDVDSADQGAERAPEDHGRDDRDTYRSHTHLLLAT